MAVSLIPACATLYQRLVLPESKRYLKSRSLEETAAAGSLHEKDTGALKKNGDGTNVAVHEAGSGSVDHHAPSTPDTETEAGKASHKELLKHKRAHFRGRPSPAHV